MHHDSVHLRQELTAILGNTTTSINNIIRGQRNEQARAASGQAVILFTANADSARRSPYYLLSMTLAFSDLSIVGILGLIVIAAVTIRGRMWNKVHVLRSVGQMTDQAIMEDALRNAMPQPAQQPAQPTMECKLAELDRLRSSERISDGCGSSEVMACGVV